MPNPDGLIEPRLSSAPVPIPTEYARGRYAGVAAILDLDRVLEMPFVQGWWDRPPTTTPQSLTEQQAVLAAQHAYFVRQVAYCCWGLVDAEGRRLPDSPGLDDVDGWAAESRAVVTWLATRGLSPQIDEVSAPFQRAATE